MQTWLNFWNLFFWLTIFGFVVNIENFFKILIYSEITWLTLYCYTLICGINNDDITLVSNSLLILGFAGLEFSIGILLLILFKNIVKTINLNENDENVSNSNLFDKKHTNVNRLYWNTINT